MIKGEEMNDIKQIVQTLFANNNLTVPKNRAAQFDKFLNDEQTIQLVQSIINHQNLLMDKWKRENRVAEIMQQSVRILNATVGKPYEAKIDFEKNKWKDIVSYQFEGLEPVGLAFDEKTKQIVGVPTQSGDVRIMFKFKLEGEPEEAAFHEKPFLLVINPDPKALWKNIESDRNDPYWKEDNLTVFEPLGDRHILASSRRGRSHANVGSFREDDFGFQHFEDSGWSIVAVADGAGSAKLSRKGSALACTTVVDYFSENLTPESFVEFDELLAQHKEGRGDNTQKKLNRFVYNHLGKAALHVHKKLEEFAKNTQVALKDLSTTLIFTLFKKYDIGYAFLSFGVGDCPIALLNKDASEVMLMNWLDVGEYGGGTRFITMPEIFQSDKFATRFGFKLVDDFSFLFLMSDGIYDPKFVVEANLQDIRKWKEFLADLGGKNEDGIKVELTPDNKDIRDQLSAWMDFWSAGNHDDRTLVIVF